MKWTRGRDSAKKEKGCDLGAVRVQGRVAQRKIVDLE